MSGGNGVDIAAVYQLLSQVAQTVLGHSRQLDDLTRDVHDLKRDVHDLKRDVKVLGDGQATLRQTLTEYHSSVIGHGILISQLEDRVRRIEHHLNLPPAA
jgi:chromosome segregation ATPase